MRGLGVGSPGIGIDPREGPVTYQLGEVFNEAGFPEVTYVQPKEAQQLKGSLATPGKHVTLVGPSGSGKSTVAAKVLSTLNFAETDVLTISGRNYSTFQSILDVFGSIFAVAPTAGDIEEWLRVYKLVVIDDVHHLTLAARTELASHLKLWHERGIRLFMIGIAKTSEAILGQDPELAIRNDSWHLGPQDEDFARELLSKGQRALNIEFPTQAMQTAVDAAQGSPSILQAIARIACVAADVLEEQQATREVPIDLR